jgi:hypothetical protein
MDVFSPLISMFLMVFTFSVSGYNNLEIAKAAGADMTEAAIKCSAGIPKEI